MRLFPLRAFAGSFVVSASRLAADPIKRLLAVKLAVRSISLPGVPMGAFMAFIWGDGQSKLFAVE